MATRTRLQQRVEEGKKKLEEPKPVDEMVEDLREGAEEKIEKSRRILEDAVRDSRLGLDEEVKRQHSDEYETVFGRGEEKG